MWRAARYALAATVGAAALPAATPSLAVEALTAADVRRAAQPMFAGDLLFFTVGPPIEP